MGTWGRMLAPAANREQVDSALATLIDVGNSPQCVGCDNDSTSGLLALGFSCILLQCCLNPLASDRFALRTNTYALIVLLDPLPAHRC